MFRRCYAATRSSAAGGLREELTYPGGVLDRRDVASWLQGPGARTLDPDAYPGERLGLPRTGPRSIARFGRRLVAVFVDWTMCQLLAFLLFRVQLGEGGPASFVPLAIFAVENILLLSTLGFTVGHRLLGLALFSLGGRRPSFVQVLVRTALLCLAVPALIWDRDGRGLHDKAAGTLLLRVGTPT